jgi:hypothetical protein
LCDLEIAENPIIASGKTERKKKKKLFAFADLLT